MNNDHNWWNNGNNWNNRNNWNNDEDNHEDNANVHIINAIFNDDAERLKELLSAGVDPNLTIHDFPLLSLALGENTSPKVGALLLSLGADPNKYFYHYYEKITPLMYAVEELNVTGVRMMMKAGADPFLKSEDKYQTTAYDMIQNMKSRLSNSHLEAAEEIVRLLLRTPSRKNLRKTRRALKPNVRGIMGSLAVRGPLPASLVSKEILPFLSTRYTRKRRGSSKSPKGSRSRSGSRTRSRSGSRTRSRSSSRSRNR